MRPLHLPCLKVKVKRACASTIPQNVNWAVKSDYIRLMTEVDKIQSAENDSVEDVMKSVCFIRVK